MKFTVVKKGYDTNEVDRYVAETEAKLEEYRKMEAVISNSIISAESARDKIIEDAEQKAKEIVGNASSELTEQVDAIKKMLVCEKKALDDFCAEYDAVVQTYFTSKAAEITAPLKEKLQLLESAVTGGDDEADPFGEIKNFF